MLGSRAFGSRSPSRLAIALLIAATCGLFIAAVGSALSSGSVGWVTALAIALSPILILAAWRRPLLFPYGAYAMLIPFDLLLLVPAIGTAARICGAISGAALLFWLLRTRTFAMPGAALAGWLAWIAWAALSLLWTMNTENGLREIGTLVQVGVLYAIVSLVPATLRDLRLIFAAVAIGGVVAALFGINELAHPSAQQQLINQVSDRIPLLIGGQKLDINQFADSLLVPLAISIVAGVRTRSLLLKGCALAAVCTILYAVSLAASREAFVAVAFMLVYFAWALRERAQIFGLAGLLSAVALANQNLLNRFLIASASGGSGRFSIWTAGIAAFREHWLVGAGAGSFATAYDAVYLKVFQRYDMGWSRAAHNMLLQNSVEYGVIGMSVLATAFCLTLMSVSRIKREHPAYGLKVSAVGGLIALCIAGFFIDLTTAKMFWLTVALIAQVRQHLPAITKHQECVIRERPRSEFSLG